MNWKSILQIALFVIIVVLIVLIYNSIQEPVRFNREVSRREGITIQRLKDIRTAQLAFKSEHGFFANDFDTLINFIKYGNFTIVKQIGDEDALADGLISEIIRDTVRIPILDSIFPPKYPIDSLRYVPFGDPGSQFTIGATELETNSGVWVQVFEAAVENNVFLKGLDPQMLVNYNDTREKMAGFPGLRVGSLTETTNNAGNWE